LGWLAEASDCISTFCFHLVVALLASSAFIILHSAFFGHWAGLIASGRADDFKETALLPDFLTEIFCGLLGYTGPASAADTFTFSRERHVEVDGKLADVPSWAASRRTRIVHDAANAGLNI
jgi:hypothetical protein